MNARLILCLIIFMLSGCTANPVTKLVNEKFPPINIDLIRQAAIDSTAESLSLLQYPNIASKISLSDAEKALYTESLRKQGVTQLKLSGEKQLIHIHATFSKLFTEDDVGGNEETRKILAKLRPEISGSIDAYTGVSGELVTEAGKVPELQLRFLPGLSRVEVWNLKLAEKVDATTIGEILADLLNKYRDNVTGELARAPFSRMTVPVIADKSYDLTKTFKLVTPGTDFTVDVKADPVTLPVKLSGVAWLVKENQFTVIMQLLPKEAPPTSAVKVDNTFDAIDEQITGFMDSSFGVMDPINTNLVAVRKELLALTMNKVINQAAVCASGAGGSHQEVESKIPMPNADEISCSSDRDCESSRTCSFSARQDNRDCSACILSAPKTCWPGSIFGPGGCIGGGCRIMGQDPTCQILKQGQQALYDAEANLAKADCDRLRAMETAACQAEVIGQKALCEAGKNTLSLLGKTGNFANIDIKSDIKTNNLNVCVRDFSLSSSLDRVAFNFGIRGHAEADVSIKFVPLDIVGHLACQMPWGEKKTFTAELRDSTIGVSSAIKIIENQENAYINFDIDEITVKSKLSPGPTEFLLTSPNLTVSCAGLNLLKPLAVLLYPFIPELQGNIDQKIKKQSVSLAIPLPVLKVGDLDVRVGVSDTPQALVITGDTK